MHHLVTLALGGYGMAELRAEAVLTIAGAVWFVVIQKTSSASEEAEAQSRSLARPPP